ncbi:DoxX family protein [Geodermatophilus marinus]|uniref:DoxX family protein n=1 Tax=Geodermatophilus sp. LHW52908 TaxID=2303986 RepID=UPI000E3C6110|nr:DoxX family protein [Geodermatophilus sp. LHW52908]RFU22370.1 DoxX family protein [Geodermatophilus sp. LHW52908]
MLLRRIARPLLASSFVYGGIQTLRKPQDRVPGARPIVEAVAEQADKQLPVEVPRDVEQWVKADAAVKVAAGSMLALGKLPRLSALLLTVSVVPTTLAGHRFWEHEDPDERFGQLADFLKNTSMLGGLLLATADTAGRPSVGYRARRAARLASETTEKNLAQAQKRAAKASQRATKAQKKATRTAGKKAGKGTAKSTAKVFS